MEHLNNMESSERYQILRMYLTSGEQILWSGNPCTTRKNKIKLPVLFFVIFWTGFAVFWTVMASSSGGWFGLFGIPFLIIGFRALYKLIISPRRNIPRTVYAVTDKRAILLIPSKSGYDMTSYMFNSMNSVSLSDIDGDSGSIVFLQGNDSSREYLRAMRWDSDEAAVPTDRFLLIDRVNEVYRLILNQIEGNG